MTEFVPRRGPIKSLSSNTISDQYRDSITISYQYVGNTVPDCSFVLNGKTYATPIMMGPVHGLNKEDEAGATVLAAQAVNEAGSIYWTHFHDKEAWTRVLATGVPAIRTIKPLADNSRLLEEIAFDTEGGAVGYAMDIDHGMTKHGVPDKQQEQFASKTVDDFKLLNDASPLPFFLKGVLSIHDALAAKEAGVAGIVLSGHNNRFPCAVPPLKILPEIRKAVGREMMIFVDGGINSGYEAFKAIALGADGVLTARTLMGAYVTEGPDGLTYKLQEMTAELKGAMANTGSKDLKHINRQSIILP